MNMAFPSKNVGGLYEVQARTPVGQSLTNRPAPYSSPSSTATSPSTSSKVL